MYYSIKKKIELGDNTYCFISVHEADGLETLIKELERFEKIVRDG